MQRKVFNIERTRNVKLKKSKETREGVKKKKSYLEVKGLKVRKRNACLYLLKTKVQLVFTRGQTIHFRTDNLITYYLN